MSLKRMSAIMVVAALPFLATARHVAAQTSPLGESAPSFSLPASPPTRGRPRIDIYPAPLLHRRCIDWYELQYRPSGTVLYPQMRCWWVRG